MLIYSRVTSVVAFLKENSCLSMVSGSFASCCNIYEEKNEGAGEQEEDANMFMSGKGLFTETSTDRSDGGEAADESEERSPTANNKKEDYYNTERGRRCLLTSCGV